MDVIQTAQCFEMVDGNPRFLHTKILYRLENQLHYACTLQRLPSGSQGVELKNLSNITPIPSEACFPRYTLEMTKAPDPMPPNCFLKRPDLMAYTGGVEVRQSMLQDIHACEMLSTQPHKNIARFYGCEVSRGRVVGLCSKRYRETLMARENPASLNKQQRRSCDASSTDRHREMLRNAISHIHSLEHAHNDINPSNIMFDDDDDTLVITDFDSCLPFGAILTTTKRTPGWHDPSVQTSNPGNDWDAFSEVSYECARIEQQCEDTR